MRPVQYHRGSAVRTHYQSGILVLFIHLSPAPFILPYPLNDIPYLLRHQRRVGSLKHQAFLFGMFNMTLVFVGLRAVLHIDRVAQIQLVFQHIGDGAVAPVIGLFHVQ